jgi:hypothetical protein
MKYFRQLILLSYIIILPVAVQAANYAITDLGNFGGPVLLQLEMENS